LLGFVRFTYKLLYIYIYSIPPDDGLKICPKHVEVDGQNKLRINSASSWFHYTGVLLTNGVMQWRLITKGIHA